MANNSRNVTASKPKAGGAIHAAPLGTALPVDAASALNDAFKSLGYVSEEGLTNANSPERESHKAWGGDTVLSSQTGRPDTLKFKLIEALNPEVLKVVYGHENVTGELDTGIAVKVNAADQPALSWVIDMILKNNALKRIVVPCASVSEIAEIVYSDTAALGYDITITAEPDGDGQTHYEYIVAANAAAAAAENGDAPEEEEGE